VADTLRKHVPEPHKPNGALRPKTSEMGRIGEAPLGYPSWSRNSEYIYFDITDNSLAFYRVGVNDPKLDRLVRLTNIRRS